jgi:hypothetical protein
MFKSHENGQCTSKRGKKYMVKFCNIYQHPTLFSPATRLMAKFYIIVSCFVKTFYTFSSEKNANIDTVLFFFAQNMVGQVTYTTGMIFHRPPHRKFPIDGPVLIYLYFQHV